MASMPFTAATYGGPRRAGPGWRRAAAALCLLAAGAAGRVPGAVGCGTTVGHAVQQHGRVDDATHLTVIDVQMQLPAGGLNHAVPACFAAGVRVV